MTKGDLGGGHTGWGAPSPARATSAPADTPPVPELLLQTGRSLHATLTVDSHGRIAWMDTVLALASGWTDGSPVGHPASEVLARLPWLTRALDDALKGREAGCEGSGSGQRLSALVVPVFGEGDTPLGVCARLRVMDSEQAEAASREALAREQFDHKSSLLRATFDSIADGVVVVDLDRQITAFNRRFQEMWGLTDAMLEDRDAEQALARAGPLVKDPEAFIERVQRRFVPSNEEDIDLVELRDGRVLERKSLPQRLGDTIIGRVWSYREVTAEHRAHAEREQLLREAQEAIRVRDDFLSIAAHELKTPLTPLKLHLQLMRSRAVCGGTLAVHHMDKALSQVSRLAVLVNDLLDASRIQAGKLELTHERIPLREFIREVLSDIRTLSALHTLDFEPPAEPLFIEGDRGRLAQVLTNLVENAFKYSPTGGTVHVTARREGTRAIVSVKDDGIGIPKDQQEHLFERFFRARNAPISGFGGLGLGLYICRDIVARHGGHIWVESEVERGSTFHFSLPLVDDAAPAR
ncbi:sensor histidine kinase [Pyxidicoccus sp. 3LG]